MQTRGRKNSNLNENILEEHLQTRWVFWFFLMRSKDLVTFYLSHLQVLTDLFFSRSVQLFPSRSDPYETWPTSKRSEGVPTHKLNRARTRKNSDWRHTETFLRSAFRNRLQLCTYCTHRHGKTAVACPGSHVPAGWR